MLGALLGRSGEKVPLEQGPASIDIELKAKGDSVAALMGGLLDKLKGVFGN